MASVPVPVPLRSMVSRPPTRALTPLAAAAVLTLIASGAARADDSTTAPIPAAPVQTVQVFSHGADDQAGVTGFSQPLSRTPIQVITVDATTLADIGAQSLSDLTRLDASITDSYNAVGYWTTFTVRGFQVDNRTNFRRDGLPINAETVLSLDNKSGVEVEKGLSGMQAGLSAPGGLVNLVVKRPDADLRDVSLNWEQHGTVGVGVDLSQRFGLDRQFGVRVNLAAKHLDPNVWDAKGHNHDMAVAADWRIDRDHLLEFEYEHNLQSEPSVPGFSLLGGVLPDAHSIDPHINLNDQPWSLPVVTQGNTMSLRYTQALDAQWKLKVQALQQQLVSNDRLAYPLGHDQCTPAPDDDCHYYGADGTFSLYDFRSEGERRVTRDLDVSAIGDFATGAVRHSLTTGVLISRFGARFHDETYNYVGEGDIGGRTFPAGDDSTPSFFNTNRVENSTEFYLRDAVKFSDAWTAWAGLRHTRIQHTSADTSLGEADDATDYTQAFTTPWLAITRQLTAQDMAYVSWGEGIQSDVAPTPGSGVTYTNAGQPLRSTISKQWEAGYKHGNAGRYWGLTAYRIEQAYAGDQPGTPEGEDPTYVHDGITRSLGLEAEAQTRVGAFTLRASAMAQRVRREGSSDAANNGLRLTNVPDQSVKLFADYAVGAIAGLNLQGDMVYEGKREVLPDNSVSIPGWTRFDAGLRYVQQAGNATTLTWRAGVDNLFDRRAWREAPYQYDHAYLFPLAARTFRASVEASF